MVTLWRCTCPSRRAAAAAASMPAQTRAANRTAEEPAQLQTKQVGVSAVPQLPQHAAYRSGNCKLCQHLLHTKPPFSNCSQPFSSWHQYALHRELACFLALSTQASDSPCHHVSSHPTTLHAPRHRPTAAAVAPGDHSPQGGWQLRGRGRGPLDSGAGLQATSHPGLHVCKMDRSLTPETCCRSHCGQQRRQQQQGPFGTACIGGHVHSWQQPAVRRWGAWRCSSRWWCTCWLEQQWPCQAGFHWHSVPFR